MTTNDQITWFTHLGGKCLQVVAFAAGGAGDEVDLGRDVAGGFVNDARQQCNFVHFRHVRQSFGQAAVVISNAAATPISVGGEE